jgi:pimeloyl-ACP methyl ester carboxylesterase
MSVETTDRAVRGFRLSVTERGAGDPVLLIHGTGASALGWGRTVERLEPLGRVIVYDRRGCGDSERGGAVSVREHAQDASVLLEDLDAIPAAVIGRSYGGEVAIDLALRRPELVRALVLLEPALLRLVPEAAAWEARLRERLGAAAAEGVDRVGEAFIGEVLGPSGWAGLPRDLRRSITRDGPSILAELDGGRLDAGLGELGAITAPTLVVAGADSPEPFRRVSDLVAGAIPGAELASVEGGHRVDPSEPVVLQFLERVRR